MLLGQVAIYEANGTYQIYCKDIVPEGLGDLYIQYDKLKKKLETEGLFDEQYKKKIPFIPKRVGVITSRTGAVIRDIINVSTRRFNKVNLLIYPAATQGVNVAETVINGIRKFNELNNVDVIIIARGGGSFEDLFGFNDELLAREIFASKIPIISAVGHETDFTICDFVSDLRAPTPSAAAELVYPEITDIISKIDMYKIRNIQAIKNYINIKKQKLNNYKVSRLDKVASEKITNGRLKIDSYLKRMENTLRLNIQKNRNKYINLVSSLDAMSPLKTMTRGYVVAQASDGKIINKKEQVKINDNINIKVIDGTISAKVTEVF